VKIYSLSLDRRHFCDARACSAWACNSCQPTLPCVGEVLGAGACHHVDRRQPRRTRFVVPANPESRSRFLVENDIKNMEEFVRQNAAIRPCRMSALPDWMPLPARKQTSSQGEKRPHFRCGFFVCAVIAVEIHQSQNTRAWFQRGKRRNWLRIWAKKRGGLSTTLKSQGKSCFDQSESIVHGIVAWPAPRRNPSQPRNRLPPSRKTTSSPYIDTISPARFDAHAAAGTCINCPAIPSGSRQASAIAALMPH